MSFSSRCCKILYRRILRAKVHLSAVRSIPMYNIPKSGPRITCVLGFSFYTLLGFEQKLSAEDELIQTIKHCILFIQKSDFVKAEQLLHVALRQAQQIRHELGITYIYDVMANLALEREQLDKAKSLFISVSQRLISDGVAQDDLRIVHISIKLAKISHMKKEYELAQVGYDWCLKKLTGAFEKEPKEEISKLIALTEDWYGRLFVDCNKHEHGLNLMASALNRMRHISSVDQEYIVQQINDLGTVCDRLGRVDESIAYFKEAIELGKKMEYDYLGAVHINLGRVYIKKNLLAEARKSCGYGWRLGYKLKLEEIQHEAAECLKEINNLKA